MAADPITEVLSGLRPPWVRAQTGATEVLVAQVDGNAAAVLQVEVADGWLVAGYSVGGWGGYQQAVASAVLRAVTAAAARMSEGRTVLVTTEALIRHQARLGGFTGPLRGRLQLEPGPGAPAPGTVPRPSGADFTDAAVLAMEIRDFRPDLRITVSPPPGHLRRLAQRAAKGVDGQIRLHAAGPAGELDVLVPVRSDLLPEPVAMALDTAMAVKSRFPTAVRSVRALSFDLAERGMATNHVAGVANHYVAQVALNAAYCCAGLLPALLYHPSRSGPGRPSAATSAANRIDKVTAHEFGHYFDFYFQARRYPESIEFRRQLGLVLGVPTLEAAVRGDDPSARDRLAHEVSPYATTNLAEAMAELFAVWWFGGPACGPLLQRYDQLIERYFPS